MDELIKSGGVYTKVLNLVSEYSDTGTVELSDRKLAHRARAAPARGFRKPTRAIAMSGVLFYSTQQYLYSTTGTAVVDLQSEQSPMLKDRQRISRE